MSEHESRQLASRAFLLNRAPGKRRVKPTAIISDEEHLIDDESDEDFVHQFNSDDDDEREIDDEDDGIDVDIDEEEAESSADDSSVQIIESDRSSAIQPDGNPEPLMCSVCLNIRNVHDDRVIQCDKCGIAVHESCYAVDDEEAEQSSVVSNYSTEPWFCEPCLFAMEEPPNCELCPSRYGAFKRSDVGGSWIHLTCAMYTPGITFGDVDNLSAVSYQEIDCRRFGRKACDGCSGSVLEARTGITTGCEAGMCKQNYHISCAQRMGLLIDAVAEKMVNSCQTSDKAIDPHFILCKKHNTSEVISKKRKNYAIFMRQEQRRMSALHRRMLNEREDLKLNKQRALYNKRIAPLLNVTIHQPAERNKRPRMMQSSAECLDAFTEKAELVGVSATDFNEEFIRLPPSQITYLAPAFSEQFIRYHTHRESTVFGDDQKRLTSGECELSKVRQAEEDLQLMHDKISAKTMNTSDTARKTKRWQALVPRFNSLCKQLNITFEKEGAI